MKFKTAFYIGLLCFLSQFPLTTHAQSKYDSLQATIQKLDSLFWLSYNNCDSVGFRKFFKEDLEFYHDKGGVTMGLNALATSLKKNLCSNPNFRLRRAAVKGTVQIFPMENSGKVYGALISGSHVFYIREGGKERLDGLAKFTHLWMFENGSWKMSRILSYDHGPAPQGLVIAQ